MALSRLFLLHSRFSTAAHRRDLAMVTTRWPYLNVEPRTFAREALRGTPQGVPRERRVCRFSAESIGHA